MIAQCTSAYSGVDQAGRAMERGSLPCLAVDHSSATMVYQASRRSFLPGLAGGAALWPAASLGELSPLLAATSESESYWQMIRWQFPFREDKVPMNAANLCPSPLPVAERVTELTRDIDIDCSFYLG